MTDMEMRNLCAEAMGWKHLGAVGVPLTAEELRMGPSHIDATYPKQLWCLSGHNDWWLSPQGDHVCEPCYGSVPKPLEDDAAAMALLKRFPEQMVEAVGMWRAALALHRPFDLNAAIVECVAKMQESRREVA